MRWMNMWNAGSDLSDLEEFLAPDFASHSAPPGIPAGADGVRMWVNIIHTAFPDGGGTVEDVIVADDKVVVRFEGFGTHLGEFFGAPPTGRQMRSTGINIFRIADGKIVEHWNNADDLGVMRQLGLIPS